MQQQQQQTQPASDAPVLPEDKRLKRFVLRTGSIVPSISFDALQRQCKDATNMDMDCCAVKSFQDERGTWCSLVATKKIQKFGVITAFAPTYCCSSEPFVPLTRIEDGVSLSVEQTKDEVELVKRLSLFQNVTSLNFSLYFTPGVASKADAKTLENSSYLGFAANEGTMVHKIANVIDAFITAHIESAEPPSDAAIDKLAAAYVSMTFHGVNCKRTWVSGVCIPVIVATRDIVKSEALICANGIDVWIGERCIQRHVATSTMSRILGAIAARTSTPNYATHIVAKIVKDEEDARAALANASDGEDSKDTPVGDVFAAADPKED